jgi:hypothetical protein
MPPATLKTLHLTSPLTRGITVAAAQRWLTENVFGQDFKPGPVDGQFGEATARACIRAKFWLGYPDARQLGTYGDELDSYLQGTKLPITYRRRRQARAKQAQQRPLREKALANLRRHLGEKELPPSSNRVDWASLWYGVIGPWCAMAATRAYVDAGSKAFERGKRYAYVPFIVADARAGRNGLAVTHDPKPGDLVCFDWEGDGVADHVGLFIRWTSGNDFESCEGNTSAGASGSQSNGGMVAERSRHKSQVAAFVHVGR